MRQAFYTSKFYISKKSEKEVCFKLDFEIEISGGDEKIYKVILCFCIALIFLIVCLIK